MNTKDKDVKPELKEDAPINSTGSAVAGTTGERPGPKSRLTSILRRRMPNL